ncbi:MarR family transcriptional regulator [Luteimonas marina]|uniref:MarR family transcriptional regulator n=1 Tax=Luteimonas marina TaxID=488485 RepID=A0A5C5U3Z4_9GAMM|nr:MarR family transcriptional regulator [Luteimonas marina]TWT20302.1 MarR family transcriptional regulator [Luteimonas marina]
MSGDDAMQDRLRLLAQLERQIRMLGDGLAAETTAGGVSPIEWLALCWLHDHPGVPLTALAEGLHMHMGTASRLLQSLTDRGFVESHRLSDNRRRYAISLTPLGRRMQAAEPCPHGRMRRALHRLSDEDLATVSYILAGCLKQGDRA